MTRTKASTRRRLTIGLLLLLPLLPIALLVVSVVLQSHTFDRRAAELRDVVRADYAPVRFTISNVLITNDGVQLLASSPDSSLRRIDIVGDCLGTAVYKPGSKAVFYVADHHRTMPVTATDTDRCKGITGNLYPKQTSNRLEIMPGVAVHGNGTFLAGPGSSFVIVVFAFLCLVVAVVCWVAAEVIWEPGSPEADVPGDTDEAMASRPTAQSAP